MYKNQKGFSVVEVLVAIVILTLLGAVGWLVYDRQNNQKASVETPQVTNTTESTANDVQPEPVDETLDWVKYSNEGGEFSVKHPKAWVVAKDTPTCTSTTLWITLIGTKETVGDDCYGNQGQISLGSTTDTSYDYIPTQSSLANYTKESVNVAGVDGYKVSGELKTASTYYEKGAEMITYSFMTNDRVYFFQYRQNAKSPNLMSDFNTLVTKTLSFN